MTFWFRIAFTWWLGHFEGTLHVDKIHVWFKIANITHALPVPVYRQTDFTPKRVVVSRLHDTAARFRTGVKFSPRYKNRGKLTPGWLAPAWHFVVVLYKQIYRAMRGNWSELAPGRTLPWCHVNTPRTDESFPDWIRRFPWWCEWSRIIDPDPDHPNKVSPAAVLGESVAGRDKTGCQRDTRLEANRHLRIDPWRVQKATKPTTELQIPEKHNSRWQPLVNNLTSHKWSPIQITKGFPAKSLQLDTLVNDQCFLYTTVTTVFG